MTALSRKRHTHLRASVDAGPCRFVARGDRQAADSRRPQANSWFWGRPPAPVGSRRTSRCQPQISLKSELMKTTTTLELQSHRRSLGQRSGRRPMSLLHQTGQLDNEVNIFWRVQAESDSPSITPGRAANRRPTSCLRLATTRSCPLSPDPSVPRRPDVRPGFAAYVLHRQRSTSPAMSQTNPERPS
jgi:hypothetical protein